MQRTRALFLLLRTLLPVMIVLVFSLSAQVTRAETRIYSIDPAQSTITISGTVSSLFGPAPIAQQGTGSLTATYNGTIHADRTIAAIQFIAGGAIDANVSGDWQPLADGSAGSAPADYGARADWAGGTIVVNFAGRDLVADLTSTSTPVDGGGNFDLASSTVNFTTGTIAYRANFGLAPGTTPIAGNSGNLSGTGSVSAEGLFEILTLPINSTFTIPVDSTTSVQLTLNGELVASAPLPEDLQGDFNDDGHIDAADYVAWQKGLGVETTEDNYTLWRTNFGRTAGGGALGQTPFAVPEPASLLLVLVCIIATAWSRSQIRPTT
jgi:hypothetical protein